MEKSNDTGKIIGALLIGTLAGAVLGVLFAPDKGSVTRAKLAGGAKDLAGDIKKKVMSEINALREKIQDLESLAEQGAQETAGDQTQRILLNKHS
ncbi:MAG: hypothetical protein K0S12_192 [Bacteroidetes bacterium]|jgi:gas vesicle protein|nr:hypothetical protein [Bacteroidota bacterium]